jgi:hypothetical protein
MTGDMSLGLYCRNRLRNILARTVLGKVVWQSLCRPRSGEIILVSATRMTEEGFWNRSALGQSLADYRGRPDLQLNIHFENARGLPEIYNRYITRANKKKLLVFLHDDVWLDSRDWLQAIRFGLGHFDIIGVAGNRRLMHDQPAWCFKGFSADGFHWDHPHLAGEVGHGKDRNGAISKYGSLPATCKALDGVLLAARCDLLIKSGVRFDTEFKFHFYDLDFCRSANHSGLQLGVWGIAITHQSGGSFGSPSWNASLVRYRHKWSSASNLP